MVSVKKIGLIGEWMLAGALTLPLNGHITSPVILPTPSAPVANMSSVRPPLGISNPKGYQRLIAERRAHDACMDLFVTQGIDRLRHVVGFLEFTAGGTVTIIPPHDGNKGQCLFTSRGRTYELPELMYLFESTSRVLQAQYDYEPCAVALRASPELQKSCTMDTLKAGLIQRIQAKHSQMPSALVDFLGQMVGGPLKDYCDFSTTVPLQRRGDTTTYMEKLSRPHTVMDIAPGTYHIYSLLGKSNSGSFTITVENPRGLEGLQENARQR